MWLKQTEQGGSDRSKVREVGRGQCKEGLLGHGKDSGTVLNSKSHAPSYVL